MRGSVARGGVLLGLCCVACQSPCHATSAGQICGSSEVRTPVLDQVHHWPIVAAKINGREVRVLVDTGAGMTTVSAELLGVADGSGITLASLCIEDMCLEQTPAWAEDNQIVRA